MVNIKKLAIRAGLLSLLFCLPFGLLAQESNSKLSVKIQSILSSSGSQQTVAAFIYFKDKGDNIEEKLVAAKNALTPTALQRRIINRGEANAVDITDLPINPDYLNAVEPEVVKIRHQLKGLNAVSVEATPASLEVISDFDFVEKVTLVNKIKRTPDPVVTPSQLKSDQQSMLLQPESITALDYGGSYTQNNQISVPTVHDLGYDGTGVVIAIFDSGFNRLTHEAFNQMNIADTWDFVNGDADVGDGSDMGTGSHGTNTLSTIGGYAPGDLIGPAYGATYYLAKTENNESELHVEEDNWCAAAEWAETNGAQIITSSLGYTDFDTGTDYTWQDMDGDTTVITQCADLAATKGIVVINSAGNNGYHSTNNTLGAPSDGHFVIAAGAVTSSGTRSSFSSVGLSADGRIKPDVMAMGSSVRVASATSNTGYSSVNGTSFSCPLTAGVAALVIESNPGLTAAQVRDILRNTADNASSPNREYGYGILNALAAVETATANTLNASFAHTSNLLEVSFTDTSSAPTGESITNWSWNFGDGNTSSAQNPVHTYATAGEYTVSLTVTDSASNTDSVMNTVAVTDTLSYCTSQGNNSSYEWIAQVNMGSFSNSSGAANYSDFTSMIIDVEKVSAQSLTLVPGFSGSSYSEHWKIWIDLNKDGDFEDAGEELFSGSGSSTVTGSMTVPASAITGTTTMRVTMKYNGAPTPCETFSYGEVEDYTVNLTEAQVGPTASFTTVTDVLTATFTDTSTSSGSSIVAWNWNFGDGNTSATQSPSHTYATANTYPVTLTVEDNIGNTDSITQNVTVQDLVAEYCVSKGNNVNYEWINQVDIGTFTNSSGAAGYTDFTSMVIDITAGQNYATTLSPGFASSSYSEYWKVWIDFNKDGDFVDTGEEVFSDSGGSNVTGTISIPASVETGETRMRVSMKYNGTPTSCETFSYGEVEDYTVNIGN